MANILAVDDNLELCKLIRTALERDGHRVETRQAGRDLTEALCRWADCILLDVMMPGEDGFAVCRRIRSLTEAPILFLSARTDEAAVLEGLGIGADDFLSKPFRVAELRARVAAHLRRQSRTPAHRMVRNGVAFDLTARSAAVEGKALPLTRSEYAICEYLALHSVRQHAANGNRARMPHHKFNSFSGRFQRLFHILFRFTAQLCSDLTG